MNPPPLPSKQSKLFGNNFVFEPMPDPENPISLLENLLKFPGRVVHELHQTRAAILTAWLLIFGIVGVAIYGIVVGAQSGGAQLWIAPAKLGLGTLLSVLICLPSLYIFACLGGIDAQLRSVCGALFAAVCLSSILLIGFAPVAWIFSQSTDSIVFMGTLHLLFWVIGIRFGLRLIDAMARFLGATRQRTSQNMERHFHFRLFSNDDDAAAHHRSVENIFADGEEILSRALDGFDREFAARGRSKVDCISLSGFNSNGRCGAFVRSGSRRYGCI